MEERSSHPAAVGASIGEVARRTGIPIETLRFYDRSGLIGDLPRTTGGHRVFDDAALGLLDVVVRLRRTGMPIGQVRVFVEQVRADTDRSARIALLTEHREHVREQISRLGRDLAVIDWKVQAYTAAERGEQPPAPPPGWPEVSDLVPPPDDLRATATPDSAGNS